MSILKKLLVLVVVIAVVVVAAQQALRVEALCQPVVRKKAVMAVPGSVTVVAEYASQLLAEVGGRLISSELDPGRSVKKGEVVAQLDPGDLELEIERIEIDTDAAKKRIEVGSQIELELKSAEEELAELETRAASNNYPMAELYKKRRGVEGIKQRRKQEVIANEHLIAGYENTLASKKRTLAKMTIVAPYDGVVAEDLTTPNQLIGDHTPIASLIATKRTVEAKISEENFAGIKKGQPATIRFLTYGDYLYKGSVAKILPTADPTTQRYIVHLDVDIAAEKLGPGMTGEVSILTGERENALLIPRRALRGSAVFVVNDNRVAFRRVETGFTSLDEVEVLSGLEEGDLVIVDQLDKFRDGDRVKVVVEAASKS